MAATGVIFQNKCDWVDETSKTYGRPRCRKNATESFHSATGLILSTFNATELNQNFIYTVSLNELQTLCSASRIFSAPIALNKQNDNRREKMGKKATPRYVAGPFAPLCCVYSDFGGVRAILSG